MSGRKRVTDIERIATITNHASEDELECVSKQELADALVFYATELDKQYSRMCSFRLFMATAALTGEAEKQKEKRRAK